MYYFMKNVSNKDTFQYMTGDWYGENMADPVNREEKVKVMCSFLEENTTLIPEDLSIVDFGSGNGAVLEAMSKYFKSVKGYEIRESILEDSYQRENVETLDVLEGIPESFDIGHANILMYFSEDELTNFFEKNTGDLKALIITYRFGFVLNDEARINFLTEIKFKALAEKYGFEFYTDPTFSNVSYMIKSDYLK
ncbi:hypothetical protein Ilyop_2033 (plasmid) [Ilyobacter polytropus DSM 2926]|uniref:Class I SAM-dependent methyltransferase n=2 Tax=Ilyobacter TaxID=167639 RepID=E3HBP2_ILYPC|nr:hypothetical protein Ilyop_2033 [Ilyobacter polytropus DSM 2926]